MARVYLFFIHFLIAKQLNDDAHDFVEDLQKEHITPVVAMLLKKAKKQNKRKLSELKELFWQEIIVDTEKLISLHVKKANHVLKNVPIIADKNILEEMISVYEHAAKKAIEERKNVKKFLQVYQK